MTTLPTRTCIPCKADEKPIAPEEAEQRLQALKGWRLIRGGKAIHRAAKLKNWKEAFALVTQIDRVAEIEKHHPDVAFGWGYCEVTLTTHSIDGLHENDFIMAKKIEQLIGPSA